MNQKAKDILIQLAEKADIKVNGSRPWDIQIHDERFYDRLLRDGSLGLGESYMDGWWDVEQLEEMVYRAMKTNILEQMNKNFTNYIYLLSSILWNKAKPSRAFQVGQQHYDVGNKLYQKMLDKRMVYTCGYWKDAQNLEDAQEAKLDLVCRKLQLKPGDRLLDIGCGWGSLLIYAAQKYGVKGVGVTVSKEQLELAKEMTGDLPIEYRLQDYRDVNDTEGFDKIVSLGMFEHVGYKNYETFMKVAERNLKPDGLFLLHSFGGTWSLTRSEDKWFDKYIFPNSRSCNDLY